MSPLEPGLVLPTPPRARRSPAELTEMSDKLPGMHHGGPRPFAPSSSRPADLALHARSKWARLLSHFAARRIRIARFGVARLFLAAAALTFVILLVCCSANRRGAEVAS